MKLTKITSAVLALALTAAFGASAQAQLLNYNTGDLLIGFEQAGSANDYVVDLGSISQVLNAGSGATLTFNLSSSDLSTAFGSNWASNSQTNSVQWGLIGASDRLSSINLGGNTLAKNTLFYTVGELNAGTQTTPPKETNNATNNSINGKIVGFTTDFQAETPSSGSTASLQATIESSSGIQSWSAYTPSLNAFASGKNIEQPLSGSFTGPTDSVLDLYQLNATSVANTPATFLGTAVLSSSGVLTITTAATTPEPSTYALMIVGGLGLLVLRLRRKNASFN